MHVVCLLVDVTIVYSATNLRCFNYHIKETTRANCRMVAGRIIPAIATTTAMITGFVQLEIIKYILGAPLAAYRAGSVNLATNVYCIETLPDPKVSPLACFPCHSVALAEKEDRL